MASAKKTIRTIGLALVGLCLFLALLLLLLLRHKPAFYLRALRKPVHEVEANYRLFKDQASGAINAALDNRDPTFKLVLTEAAVNAWLNREVEIAYKHLLPDQIGHVVVRFRENTVIVAAQVDRGLLASVVQVYLRPQANGTRVRLTLERIKGGALRVPLAAVRTVIRDAATAAAEWLEFEEETDTLEVRIPQPKSRRDPSKLMSVEEIKVEHGRLEITGRTGF